MTKLLMIFAAVLSTTIASMACNLVGKNMQYNQVGLNDSDSNYYNQVRSTSSVEVAPARKQFFKK